MKINFEQQVSQKCGSKIKYLQLADEILKFSNKNKK